MHGSTSYKNASASASSAELHSCFQIVNLWRMVSMHVHLEKEIKAIFLYLYAYLGMDRVCVKSTFMCIPHRKCWHQYVFSVAGEQLPCDHFGKQSRVLFDW